MISEISPFKDFVCIKVCHNRRVRCFGIVLVCPCLYTNRTSKELQTLLSLFFFSKFELPNRGCGLSTGAAYTRNFTVFMYGFYVSSCSDVNVDVTGVTELAINNTAYRLQDDSVVLQGDQEKYACSDDECDRQ